MGKPWLIVISRATHRHNRNHKVKMEKPNSSVDRSKKSISGFKLFICFGMTTISGLVYTAIYFMVPQFKHMFDNLDSELPRITMFVLETYAFYPSLFLLGLVPCTIITILYKDKKTGNNPNVLLSLVIGNLVLSLVTIGFVVAALYAPIFYMAEVA